LSAARHQRRLDLTARVEVIDASGQSRAELEQRAPKCRAQNAREQQLLRTEAEPKAAL